MSGPSAIANPMSAKIAVSSSITWLIGWMRPISAGSSWAGKVTSMASVLSLRSSAALLRASRRVAMACAILSLRPFMSGPCALRSSGNILPSVANSAEIGPRLPSAATRAASSPASSPAASMVRINSCSSAVMSFITPLSRPSGAPIWRRMKSVDFAKAQNRGPELDQTDIRAPSWHPFLRASRRQGGLGLVDDGLECRWLANGEVRQHLAIDRHPGLAKSGDKSTVSQSEFSYRRVKSLDPQRPEGAFAALAVAKRILVGFFDRLLGDSYSVLAPTVITLGGFKDFLVLGVSGDAPFDAGHGGSPSKSGRKMMTTAARNCGSDDSQRCLNRWAASIS